MATRSGLGGPVGSEAERKLVRALREGDESAFATLLDTYAPAMLRVASVYVPSRAIAEEVVQDTWLALLRGLDRFEERSRLQTWLFRVLVNIARTRASRERRTTPFSALAAPADEGSTVDPARFLPPGHPVWPGHWAHPPQSWDSAPESHALSAETLGWIEEALAGLSQMQRLVVTLRDVIGCPAAEVCSALDISAGNQRVLLHRGRARLRQALEDHMDGRV